MNQSSVQSAFLNSPNTTGSFSWSGNNMIYIPNSNLSYFTTYNVTVKSDAMDLAGNNMQSSYTWQFTTTLPPSNNLIKNPGFESGKTSWTFYT
ncbi:MAG: Ig-like domain-containing protein, partial [Candidatus Methanoperedens sp.]|nr:Ig-like domain-containing protein [Candidatus Methanoperedens sp.]